MVVDARPAEQLTSGQTRTVPLTGDTLQAALKMRCDTSGASYAIYWANQNGKLMVSGQYKSTGYEKELKSRGVVETFADVSKPFALDAKGTGPIAAVLNTGKAILIEDVKTSSLKRKELAIKYGINAIAFSPFEDGVVEFGTTNASPVQWTEQPKVPVLPKGVMRAAFEELGALYVIYWAQDGKVFRVAADYEVPRSVNSRLRRRSDGASYISNSEPLALAVNGDGPVALAKRTGEEQVICFGINDPREAKMKRALAAKEFGIKTIHFYPFESGVLEYGVSAEAGLSDVTLDATLKMQSEATNAAYAMYWKETGGSAVVLGSYVSPKHTDELKQSGKSLSFAEASQAVVLKADASTAVGKVLSTRQPIFVKDAKTSTVISANRVAAAKEYGIESICFVPVLGGVVEYGTSDGACTATWESYEEAGSDGLPKAELEKVFRGGATYAIYWKPDYAIGKYRAAASYETQSQALSKRAAEGKTYVKECLGFSPNVGGSGPIGTAGASGVEVNIADTKNCASFQRSKLAGSYGIGSITCVPCNGGVLEYGTVTADKRGSTIGPEFQESQRPYRRTVFNGPDWPNLRSADRFEKAMKTLLDSGILRSRYKEVVFVGAVAAFTVAYNALAIGYVDFDNIKHAAPIAHLPGLNLPISIFTLTSPTLGLLLVFRTNACYARWDDSRKIWGDIINKCRSVVRQSNSFMNDEYPGYGQFQDWRRRTAAETSAFTRCLRSFLRGPDDNQNLRAELKVLGFTPEEVDGYMGSANKQCYALQQLAQTVRKSNLDGRDRARLDSTLSALCDDVGACERIFKTPIPIIYTRHASRFLGTWLALLPLALYTNDQSWNHLLTIPAVMFITFFLIGIEELGLQIEEPFSILPIEAFCDASIGAVLYDMVLSEDKSRGLDPAGRARTAALLPLVKCERMKIGGGDADEPSLEVPEVPAVVEQPAWKKAFLKASGNA
jgi:predicted membrane chloride channel (bestrophin family)